ncbi:MAG: DUF2085 domain-containing protein [Ignavibacteria bacterium]|nr:DUF2085 domain-containing protein [Ignavibacteria bacterium]
MEIKRYQKVIYFIILAISVLWCCGILLAPIWAGDNGIKGQISDGIYSFYSKSCHQLDSRSHHLFGHKLGVCSRCTSIYFAFLLGVIIYPFLRKLSNIDLPSLLWLFIPVGLMVVDVGLDLLDVQKNTFLTRDLTGGIIGVVLPFFIIPGTIRVFYEYFTPPDVIPKK